MLPISDCFLVWIFWYLDDFYAVGPEVLYFIGIGAAAGAEGVDLINRAGQEVVFLADLVTGGEYVAVAGGAAHHGLVDGGLGQDRGGDAAVDADAADADEGFVGIDLGQGLQREFADQGFAALVDLATGQDDGHERVMRIADGVAVVGHNDDVFVLEVVEQQQGGAARVHEDGVAIFDETGRVAGNHSFLFAVDTGLGIGRRAVFFL